MSIPVANKGGTKGSRYHNIQTDNNNNKKKMLIFSNSEDDHKGIYFERSQSITLKYTIYVYLLTYL